MQIFLSEVKQTLLLSVYVSIRISRHLLVDCLYIAFNHIPFCFFDCENYTQLVLVVAHCSSVEHTNAENVKVNNKNEKRIKTRKNVKRI